MIPVYQKVRLADTERVTKRRTGTGIKTKKPEVVTPGLGSGLPPDQKVTILVLPVLSEISKVTDLPKFLTLYTCAKEPDTLLTSL